MSVYVVSRRSESFHAEAFPQGEGREKLEGAYKTLTGAEVAIHKFEDRADAVAFSNIVNGSVYDDEGHARRHARQVVEGQ